MAAMNTYTIEGDTLTCLSVRDRSKRLIRKGAEYKVRWEDRNYAAIVLGFLETGTSEMFVHYKVRNEKGIIGEKRVATAKSFFAGYDAELILPPQPAARTARKPTGHSVFSDTLAEVLTEAIARLEKRVAYLEERLAKRESK